VGVFIANRRNEVQNHLGFVRFKGVGDEKTP